MIGLPLFWDQYDNAQRLQETGYGVRLPTYDWTEHRFTAAVDRLLADDDLRHKMRNAATRIQAEPGRVKAADLLERLARSGEPVTT
jgi:UDP:flavonoid glycosyltransferase YjiC (YdhE family)